jgi:hypothetical protein
MNKINQSKLLSQLAEVWPMEKKTHVPDRMTPDQVNELKAEWQKAMPEVELLKIKHPPNSVLGLYRDQMLSIMGYSRAQIAEMTGFREEDYPVQTQQDTDDSKVIFLGRDITHLYEAQDQS